MCKLTFDFSLKSLALYFQVVLTFFIILSVYLDQTDLIYSFYLQICVSNFPHQCANIGPADYNYDETISTLRYANRAKNIKNKARINEDPKDALLRQFQKEIEELKKKLEEGKRQTING